MCSVQRQSNSWCCNLLKWLIRKHTYQISAPVLGQRLDMSRPLAQEKGLELKQVRDGSSSVLRTYSSLKVGYEREHYLSDVKIHTLRTKLS